jgi:ABC-type dipeptide/oligopeptide/nickel transport system permease subunit
VSVVDPSGLTPSSGDVSAIGGELAPMRPLRKDVWRRFKRDKAAMVSLVIIVLLVLVAIFAPLIAPFGYADLTPDFRAGPGWHHLFGTDLIGRDMFSRVVYGSRVSLTIGVLASSLSMSIGLLLGAMAGFFGGWLDTVTSRITDIFLAIPYIVLAIVIASVFGGSELSVIMIIGLTTWMSVTRIVRASFLSLKQQEYVEAATALGFSRTRIIFRHILPNALQPIIVYGTISIAGVILTEAALSFLGVGVKDPTPAWGLMIAQGKGQLVSAPHLLFFPAGALVLTVLAFVFVGDGLRDALDPKMK